MSEETKKKMSIAKQGTKLRQDTKEKINKSLLGEKNPMFIEPDYRNDERFMRSNVGSTYDVMENLLWPNNIKAQRRAKKEEAAIKEETRIEKINRLYPGGYEAYKKKKEEREARKKEIRRRRNTK